jgi:hypothetical protein
MIEAVMIAYLADNYIFPRAFLNAYGVIVSKITQFGDGIFAQQSFSFVMPQTA